MTIKWTIITREKKDQTIILLRDRVIVFNFFKILILLLIIRADIYRIGIEMSIIKI